jgi:hypothetical protein
LLIGDTKDILIIVQFGNLDLVLKVSSTVDHLPMLMGHICMGDMMRSY